jgi:seryl-tRNA synthetase
MNKDVMAKTAQLDQFDEELYKVHHTLSIPALLDNIFAHTGHRE